MISDMLCMPLREGYSLMHESLPDADVFTYSKLPPSYRTLACCGNCRHRLGICCTFDAPPRPEIDSYNDANDWRLDMSAWQSGRVVVESGYCHEYDSEIINIIHAVT